MCTSRLHRVLDFDGDDAIVAADVDGVAHRLLLLAYEGPPPTPGTWVVAHAGYALAPATDEDGELALFELRGARQLSNEEER